MTEENEEVGSAYTPVVVEVKLTGPFRAIRFKRATAIIIGGRRIIVGRIWISASWGFFCVADAILIQVGKTGSTAHAQCIELFPIAAAVFQREAAASAIKYGTRAVANAATVKAAHARIDVVTDAVAVCIG